MNLHHVPRILCCSIGLIFVFNGLLTASDLVLNDGFELEEAMHWTETGLMPYWDRGVVRFDVTGNGIPSWAYCTHPGDEYDAGLEQVIHLRAGITYAVSADICYHSG